MRGLFGRWGLSFFFFDFLSIIRRTDLVVLAVLYIVLVLSDSTTYKVVQARLFFCECLLD